MPHRLAAAFALFAALGTGAARAEVPMVGSFTAEASCFATPAIRSDDNPGRVVTEPGRAYELLARNSDPGSHYLIRVPGAEPERRWVAFGCGRVGDGSQSAGAPTPAGDDGPLVREFVLAASWQPAFCEIRPRVRECRDGAAGVEGFTLHGLWPQPLGLEYCDVPRAERALAEGRRWLDLPASEVAAQTRRDLAQAMPGAASGLDRYQWMKHGTCWGGEQERFFAASVRLLDELNASAVRDLFVSRVGASVTSDEVRAAFERTFGAGTGRRVLMDCAPGSGGEPMVGELRIALEGDLDGEVSLARMVRAAAPQPRGCARGHVDPPGFG